MDSWNHLQHLSLADPDSFSSHPIHFLIGADLYGSLLLNKVKKDPVGTPTAQLTALRWILSGPTGTSDLIEGSVHTLNCMSDPPIEFLLQKF